SAATAAATRIAIFKEGVDIVFSPFGRLSLRATPARYSGSVPRPSPVTDAVRTLVLTNDHHAWSLDELLAAVRADIDSADFSTIFRAVANLERSGVVDRVDVGDGKTRYESRRAHHEHIRCPSCGRVAEVPGCVLGHVSHRHRCRSSSGAQSPLSRGRSDRR